MGILQGLAWMGHRPDGSSGGVRDSSRMREDESREELRWWMRFAGLTWMWLVSISLLVTGTSIVWVSTLLEAHRTEPWATLTTRQVGFALLVGGIGAAIVNPLVQVMASGHRRELDNWLRRDLTSQLFLSREATRAGLTGLFLSRRDDNARQVMREELEQENGEVRLMGFALPDFLGHDGTFTDLLVQGLRRKRIEKLEVMLLDPGSEGAREREELERDYSLVSNIKAVSRKLDQLRDSGLNIERRFYTIGPTTFVCATDRSLFTQQYHCGNRAEMGRRENEERQLPLLQFERGSTTDLLLMAHFDYLWDRAAAHINKAVCKAAIFSISSLANTDDAHRTAWKQVFDDYRTQRIARGESDFRPFVMGDDYSYDDDYSRFMRNRPREEGIRAFLDSRGIEIPMCADGASDGMQSVFQIGEHKDSVFSGCLVGARIHALKGATELLRRLRAEDIRLAVVSASRHLDTILESAEIAEYFPTRVSANAVNGPAANADRVAFRKDSLRRASELLREAPSSTAVIDVTASGVEAARLGGFNPIIGVDRIGDPEVLRDANAHRVVPDLNAIEVD